MVAGLVLGAVLMLSAGTSAAPDGEDPRAGGPGSEAAGSTGAAALRSKFALANRCFALAPRAIRGFVGATADGYRVGSPQDAAAFYFKPTGLGTYMLSDQDGKLIGLGDPAVRADAPNQSAEWAATLTSKRTVSFRSTVDRRSLAVEHKNLALVSVDGNAGLSGRFVLLPAGNCRRYPEAAPGASGKPFKGTNRDGTVRGFADLHLHITSELRAGGAVVYGRSFDRFGITEALGHDAELHGADGSEDVTGNLLRDGLPFGTHDTHGWPTFAGWPVNDTNTHQQVYYGWLERMWKAGERLVVAQAVEDQPICEIEPRKAHSCDETEVIAAEIKRLRGLERYVDAQSGGPGRGWFRIVEHPREARDVIERGKLAVVIGVESSNLFGCSEIQDEPQCTRKDVDRGLERAKRRGIRSVFIAHWVDNAFAGAALEGGAKGAFINVFNRYQTGHYFRTAACPYEGQGEEPDPLNTFEMGGARPVLPRDSAARGRTAAELSGGPPMQRQGPDEARRLPGAPPDRRAHADRGRPPGRVGAKAGARDRREARLPAGLRPHQHRRHLDAGGAPAALPTRRHRGRHPGPGAAARREVRHAARLPGPPSRRDPARHRHRRLLLAAGGARGRGRPIRCPTRSAPTTARSPSTARPPASAASTSTPTASRTTGCSPT